MSGAFNHLARGGRKRPWVLTSLAYALVASLAFGALYLSSRYNYLLFHGIAEVFSILIAWSIFIIAWNTRRITANDYLLFLGIAYLFVGGIDFVHTLAYRGMGVFQGYETNLPTQLWIAARYTESLSLLIAPLFFRRRLKTVYAFAAYTLVTSLLFLSIFVWDVFPACFVEGAGLTPFKKISEYVICFILLAALALLYRLRESLDRDVFILLSASILVTIASELCFTLYGDPYGLLNQLGHFLKIVSFYLVYRAIVVTALSSPYDILFRELRLSEERFRSIVENAPFGYYRVGRDGLWEYVNPVWERMYGISSEDVVGRPFEVAQLGGAPERVKDSLVRALAGESASGEFDRFTGKGDIEHHTYNIQPVRRGDEIVAVEGFVSDISGLKRIERALLESEEKYRELADTLPQVVFEIDASGMITYVNEVAYDMFGFGRDDIGRGVNVLDVIDPSDHERISSAIRKMMVGPSRGATREYLARRKDGSVFPCMVYSVAIMDSEGTSVGIRGILADITERKRMEQELERINRELVIYADVVSHDLRGPISVIQSASISLKELIDRGSDRESSSPRMKIAEIIERSSESARELIDNLLTLAKAGQVPERVSEVDVRKTVENVLAEKTALIEGRGIKVISHDDLGRITADPTHVYQLFANLISNAIVHNDNPHPEIRIMHEEERGLHRYRVRDNGSGISPDELEKIFLPMHHGKDAGTGIGLAIVKRIVEVYGGEIRAYNDGGACFEFTMRDFKPTGGDGPVYGARD